MQIIKTLNGKMQILQAGKITKSLQSIISYQITGTDRIEIIDTTGEKVTMFPSKVQSYQILPNAKIDFDGDSEQLAEILDSQISGVPSVDGSNVEISPTAPADTSKLWFNTNDKQIYFFESGDWLSVQVFETVFNDQGSTPNNTFFRTGNTTGNDQGTGYPVGFNIKIEALTINRNPNTAKTGQFWLYSNRDTGTNFANVIATFPVSIAAIQIIPPTNSTIIGAGFYISLRWNGLQTNNNVCILKYRKKI